MSKITLYKNDLPSDLLIQGDIAIDTETMGLNYKRDRLCLVQVSDQNGQVYLVQIDQGVTKAPNLEKLLTDPNTIKIFHFARFDISALYHNLGILISNVFCTKIASKLVRTYTDSHGLKDLCKDLLAIQLSKQQQSSDWGNNVLTKEQQAYAASDVLYLHQLKNRLQTLLIRENRMKIAQACFDFLPNRAVLDLAGWENVDIFAHS